MKELALFLFEVFVVCGVTFISAKLSAMHDEVQAMHCELRAIIMTQNHQFEVLKKHLHFEDDVVEQSGSVGSIGPQESSLGVFRYGDSLGTFHYDHVGTPNEGIDINNSSTNVNGK